jgi:hypothetical protein
MSSTTTFRNASNKQDLNCREKLKYLFSRKWSYQLKNKFADFDNQYRISERKVLWFARAADFLLTSFVIGLVAYAWLSGNWFLRGFAIASSIALFKSYVVEFRDLFRKRVR